jgi:hypothetical protein
MMSGARPGAGRDASIRTEANGIDGMADGKIDVIHEQNQTWQERLHEVGRVSANALTRTSRQVGMVGCVRAHQRGDVVGQNLGSHFDDQCLLRQPRDGY